ncbi:hypothetical protein KAJ83_17785 [Marivibrio halodurans]|uniref:Lipoprotein n=1 Tax=Marivibrio halodurans TaxID=2039722 RepID=A0A8J7S253_9PROT|nr:hypothetical protein [Marivibrio halodurans]MBP5858875.1 hypothetical protein [Marivibrio halodurans]
MIRGSFATVVRNSAPALAAALLLAACSGPFVTSREFDADVYDDPEKRAEIAEIEKLDLTIRQSGALARKMEALYLAQVRDDVAEQRAAQTGILGLIAAAAGLIAYDAHNDYLIGAGLAGGLFYAAQSSQPIGIRRMFYEKAMEGFACVAERADTLGADTAIHTFQQTHANLQRASERLLILWPKVETALSRIPAPPGETAANGTAESGTDDKACTIKGVKDIRERIGEDAKDYLRKTGEARRQHGEALTKLNELAATLSGTTWAIQRQTTLALAKAEPDFVAYIAGIQNSFGTGFTNISGLNAPVTAKASGIEGIPLFTEQEKGTNNEAAGNATLKDIREKCEDAPATSKALDKAIALAKSLTPIYSEIDENLLRLTALGDVTLRPTDISTDDIAACKASIGDTGAIAGLTASPDVLRIEASEPKKTANLVLEGGTPPYSLVPTDTAAIEAELKPLTTTKSLVTVTRKGNAPTEANKSVDLLLIDGRGMSIRVPVTLVK